ncbi:hypothetical protein RJT34_14690 [Clitoria ternatea]|uniref:Uncharacterized protein n=1 Tax=Clitoria ternatea TaxID=43366 RepID=A0AAN9JUE9_CLITE
MHACGSDSSDDFQLQFSPPLAPRPSALPAWYRPPIGVSRLFSSSYGYHELLRNLARVCNWNLSPLRRTLHLARSWSVVLPLLYDRPSPAGALTFFPHCRRDGQKQGKGKKMETKKKRENGVVGEVVCTHGDTEYAPIYACEGKRSGMGKNGRKLSSIAQLTRGNRPTCVAGIYKKGLSKSMSGSIACE